MGLKVLVIESFGRGCHNGFQSGILEDFVIFEPLLDVGVRVGEGISGDIVRECGGDRVRDDVGDGVEVYIFCYLVTSHFWGILYFF